MMMLEIDPAKDRQNVRKHGISLARWIIYGLIELTLYCAVITYRAETHRIISLRRANRRERKLYEDAEA